LVSFILFMIFSSVTLSVVWAHTLTCAARPHWLATMGGAVNRFTGRIQIRHSVMAITVAAHRDPLVTHLDGAYRPTAMMGASKQSRAVQTTRTNRSLAGRIGHRD